jgi:Kef-type K+ transport system membrane component KefB
MMPLITLLLIGGLMHAVRTFLPDGAATAESTLITETELAFGFVLLSALFAGRLCVPFKTPQLTGYLLAGVIAGPSVLGLLTGSMVDDLSLINGVAICLIALTAGGELNIRRMKPVLKLIQSMTVWAVVGGSLLITIALLLLRPMLPWLAELELLPALALATAIGVTLASQSPAVVMALLSETEADGPVSRVTLGLVVIADLVVIVLYALASSAAQALLGEGADPWHTAGMVLWELLGSMGVGVLVGMVLGLYINNVGRSVSLFVLTVCVVLAEAGKRAHLDPLIIALTAGLYIENATRVDASKLIHELESASLPVFLVFFAVAGASLDLVALWAVAVPATILAVVRGFALWGGTRIAAKRHNAEAAVVTWTWTGLLPQAGLALALALIMQRTFGELGDKISVLVLAVVAINQMIGPVLMRIGLVKAGEVGKKARVEFADRHGEGGGEGEGEIAGAHVSVRHERVSAPTK